MKRCRLWGALLVVLATTVAFAQSTAPTRDVVLQLTLPNGATPQLRIAEGQTGSIEMPRVGKIGFVPSVQAGSTNVVTVDVFDLNQTPHQRLGRVEAVVGGDRVQSHTTPDFGVQIVRVVTN
jgi:hypothetical protein